MPRLLKRPQAEEDLLDIWCYIARDNPDAADAWIDQLGETAWRLAENPEIGTTREELLPGIRSFPVGNYILFYQAIDDGIDLIRVLSAYRNLESLFQ
ncbi:MAG: type II toxin-antitoxin system RelE/ParE family toxin [Gammaproteobacteria bacterium]|nr:type II toxin-antitoxin system RelE/ParE family toxin [Gammaproteobacteria bacterium]